jgi:hypothetical protein
MSTPDALATLAGCWVYGHVGTRTALRYLVASHRDDLGLDDVWTYWAVSVVAWPLVMVPQWWQRVRPDPHDVAGSLYGETRSEWRRRKTAELRRRNDQAERDQEHRP